MKSEVGRGQPLTKKDMKRSQMNSEILFIAKFSFLLIIILGCVNAKAIRYETMERLSKPEDYPIEILDSSNITRPYKVIGVVQAEPGAVSIKTIIEHMKAEARKMGGDALLDLQKTFVPSGGAILPIGTMYVYGQGSRDIWSAKVIVWE